MNSKKAVVVEKAFTDLTREDIYSMRRCCPHIAIQEMLDYYKVDISQYCSKIKDIGLVVTREEKKLLQVHIKNNSMPKKTEYILTKKEMIAVRIFRGYNRVQMGKKLKTTSGVIEELELSRNHVPNHLQEKYIKVLKITESELRRIRLALAGKVPKVEELREIPSVIRQEVYEKYGGKCAECGDDKNHHIHHKTKFSEGGLHTLNNVVLLCASCHAEAHRNDHEYWLLKSIADKLAKVVLA